MQPGDVICFYLFISFFLLISFGEINGGRCKGGVLFLWY